MNESSEAASSVDIGLKNQKTVRPKFSELNPRTQIEKFWGHQNVDWITEPGAGEITRVTCRVGQVPALDFDSQGNLRFEKRAGAGFLFREGIPPSDYMALSYDIRFPEGFDFVKGGKLPGLFGGSAPMGGEESTGENGFTTRFMWRQDGAGEVYLYAPYSRNEGQDVKQRPVEAGKLWGMSIGSGSWKFQPDGQFHQIRQQIQMNKPGGRNGVLRVWYDGKLVIEKTDITFRTNEDLHAEGLCFSIFFGGNTLDWASPTDQQIDFANFEITSVE